MRILLAEDDPTTRAFVRLFLERDGHIVFEYDDGLKALSGIKVHLPDIIITDLAMPGLTGLDLIKRVKLDKDIKDIPIIVLTAMKTEYCIAAMHQGASLLVEKPVRHKKLLEAVDFFKIKFKN